MRDTEVRGRSVTSQSSPRPGRWRRFRGVTAFVFAGFVTSVLVAWGMVALMDRKWSRPVDVIAVPPIETGSWLIHTYRHRRFGATAYSQFRLNDSLSDPTASFTDMAIPHWVGPPDAASSYRQTFAFGFPWLCMKYELMAQGDGPGLTIYARHALAFNRLPAPPLYLPLRSLYRGLVANTLFYASLLSTPWAFRAVRRCRRLRSGHCPFCNYDLRGDFSRPCSECGRITAPRQLGSAP